MFYCDHIAENTLHYKDFLKVISYFTASDNNLPSQ